MGKASRIKRQRAEKFEHEPKRPTGTYQTKEDRRDARRRERAALQDMEQLTLRLAAAARAERYVKGGAQ